ncbi:MAG: hypothetical protein M1118_08615 [Chloroflexi bacterium]|nr:hypothetical protein [Chloroflexota bacterium]
MRVEGAVYQQAQPAREALRLIDLGTEDIPYEIQVLRLGETLIVALSDELFCQLGWT